MGNAPGSEPSFHGTACEIRGPLASTRILLLKCAHKRGLLQLLGQVAIERSVQPTVISERRSICGLLGWAVK